MSEAEDRGGDARPLGDLGTADASAQVWGMGTGQEPAALVVMSRQVPGGAKRDHGPGGLGERTSSVHQFLVSQTIPSCLGPENLNTCGKDLNTWPSLKLKT